MICHKNRLIFLHLPKCGGSSIELALTGRSWDQEELWPQQHLTAEETLQLYGAEVFHSYFKFTIVRNTWDLLLSYYLWGGSGLRGRPVTWWRWGREWGHPYSGTRRRWVRRPTFPEYLANIRDFNARLGFSLSGRDLTQQRKSISIGGGIAVDYVGRFEALPDEFRKICQLAQLPPPQLPHRLQSKRTRHFVDYYTPAMYELVREQYGTDIETFGFTFGRQSASCF
jgi:hypothetical protein